MTKNAERNAEIIARRNAGEFPSDIWRAMGLSRNTVIGVLNRAGLCSADTDSKPAMRKYARRGVNHCRAMAVLSPEQVKTIRRRYVFMSRQDGSSAIAKTYGVSRATILAVLHGRTWKHVA
jgi:hypothetical protein